VRINMSPTLKDPVCAGVVNSGVKGGGNTGTWHTMGTIYRGNMGWDNPFFRPSRMFYDRNGERERDIVKRSQHISPNEVFT